MSIFEWASLIFNIIIVIIVYNIAFNKKKLNTDLLSSAFLLVFLFGIVFLVIEIAYLIGFVESTITFTPIEVVSLASYSFVGAYLLREFPLLPNKKQS